MRQELHLFAVAELVTEIHQADRSCHEWESLCIALGLRVLAAEAPGFIDEPAYLAAAHKHIMQMD